MLSKMRGMATQFLRPLDVRLLSSSGERMRQPGGRGPVRLLLESWNLAALESPRHEKTDKLFQTSRPAYLARIEHFTDRQGGGQSPCRAANRIGSGGDHDPLLLLRPSSRPRRERLLLHYRLLPSVP